jgi:DNA-binding FadR family transcriptional regulator
MLQARSAIEPAIAREAAMNASDEALRRIHLAMSGAEQAPTWAEYEMYDGTFHRSVAQATENIVLVSLFDQVLQIRRSVAWDTVVRETAKPPEGYKSFSEHRAIANAIEARNPKAAQEAMRHHVGSVSSRLFG